MRICGRRTLASPCVAIWLALAVGAEFGQRGKIEVPLGKRGHSFCPCGPVLVASAPCDIALLPGNSPHQVSWLGESWFNLAPLRSVKPKLLISRKDPS